MQITVVYAESLQQWEVGLELPEGATVLDALLASRILQQCPQIDLKQNRVGVYGQCVTPETRLQAGDRVEIYRPLRNDPRERRRQRVVRQGRSRVS